MMDKFNIGPNDTIIVLHEDGTCDASFPELEDQDEVPEHVFTGAAILHALENEEINDFLHESFAKECEEMMFMEAINDNNNMYVSH